ncbi:MAG TPA: amidohydrolase [Planctomycetes bacterium]|nr:amidohydrolase [Planctomycetota bacterium]
MHDLVIRNATIVDGTGAPAYRGDLAVSGDQIVAVGQVSEPGKREIDAEGRLLAPGFVDIHTHYDGQCTWDPYLTPSGWHGVTTAVMGSCGVGFAPVAPNGQEFLIDLMEGVEDIPGAALSEGIEWGWESFPEYLDALASKSYGMDIATQVPHGPLRAYVMGQRGIDNEEATAADIEKMAALVKEGIAAGALGFSTSRTLIHRCKSGEVMPGTYAARDELFGIGKSLGELGQGVFQMTSNHVDMDQEVIWLRELSDMTGRPASFNLLQCDERPDLWRELLTWLDDAAAAGSKIRAQVAGRPSGLLQGWRCTAHPFVFCPTWQSIAMKPWPEQLATLRDPSFRARLVAEVPPSQGGFYDFLTRTWTKMFPLGKEPNYEPTPDQSLAALAKAQGKTPAEVAYDLLLEDEGEALLYFPVFNYSYGNMEPIREQLLNDNTILGLGDGGAHCGAIQDASITTYLMTHWVQGRTRGDRLPLERVIKKQTYDTAEFFGFHDRGRLLPGLRADLNLIDLERLHLDAPRVVHDLPAGGRRLIQEVQGYSATFVGGVQVYAEGETTGELPGKLVRGAQHPVARVS